MAGEPLGNRPGSSGAETLARLEAVELIERDRTVRTVKKLLGRPLADAEVAAEIAGRKGRRHAREQHVKARRREAAKCRKDGRDVEAEARRKLAERRRMAGLVHRLNERLFGGDRVGTCGNVRESTAGIKRADEAGDRCHWTGLETCGSIHACLTCGGKIRSHRAGEIETVITEALAAGLFAAMVTFTVPHWAADDLGELYGHNEPGKDPKRGIRAAWNMLAKSSAFRRFRAAYGVVGLIRAVEFTHGVNGYHPHLHLVVIYNEPPEASDMFAGYRTITLKRFGRIPTGSPSLAVGERPLANPLDPEWDDGGHYQAIRAQLFEMWEHAVHSKLDRQIGNAGVDVTPIRDDEGIGSYVSKIQYELARGDLKCGRGNSGSRSLFQVAIDAAQNGNDRDAAIWANYVEVTRGAKVITMSPELRRRYLHTAELTDQEIVDRSVEGVEEIKIASGTYAAIKRHRPFDLRAAVLTAYEDGGIAGLARTIEEALGRVEISEDEDTGLPLVELVAKPPVRREHDGQLPGNAATMRDALDRSTKRLRAEASAARWEWLKANATRMSETAPITSTDPEAEQLRAQYRPDMTADELRHLEHHWDELLRDGATGSVAR